MIADRFKFRIWNESEKCFINENNELCINFTENISEIVKPKNFSFQQCTGLKDKNGKLIYEGDIIHILNEEGNNFTFEEGNEIILKADVKWQEDSFSLHFKKYWRSLHGSLKLIPKRSYRLSCYYQFQLCIVGNIYENPELMDENTMTS